MRGPAPRPFPALLFVDSSALYAIADRRDTSHQPALELMRRVIQAGRTRLVLTNFVRAETHALILNRLGHHAADRFLAHLTATRPTIVRVTDGDERNALQLIAQYGDKDFTITDATSFVVMKRLGITHAFAFDADFRQYGLQTLP